MKYLEKHGEIRKSTKTEQEEGRKLKKKINTCRLKIYKLEQELKVLLKSCKCDLIVDMPGFPYDIRKCSVCDNHLGLV
jgi:hypothetical protein